MDTYVYDYPARGVSQESNVNDAKQVVDALQRLAYEQDSAIHLVYEDRGWVLTKGTTAEDTQDIAEAIVTRWTKE